MLQLNDIIYTKVNFLSSDVPTEWDVFTFSIMKLTRKQNVLKLVLWLKGNISFYICPESIKKSYVSFDEHFANRVQTTSIQRAFNRRSPVMMVVLIKNQLFCWKRTKGSHEKIISHCGKTYAIWISMTSDANIFYYTSAPLACNAFLTMSKKFREKSIIDFVFK